MVKTSNSTLKIPFPSQKKSQKKSSKLSFTGFLYLTISKFHSYIR